MLFGNCCSSDFSADATTVWLFGRADDLNTNSTTDWLLAPKNCCAGNAQHRLNNELAMWSLLVLVWTQAQQRLFGHYCTGSCLGRWLQHGLYKGQVVWAGEFNTTLERSGCLETVVHVTSTHSIKDWLFGQVTSTPRLYKGPGCLGRWLQHRL